MKKKTNVQKKASESPEVLSSKKERLESFLSKKDEMNSIRVMLSIDNGCNSILKNGMHIFEYAWANDMLTLCNVIVDCPDFDPNATCMAYGLDRLTPISHSVYIDTFDENVPAWKRKLYFEIVDKIFRNEKTDFTLVDKTEDVHMNLLMYIAEDTANVEYFIEILDIAIKMAIDSKKIRALFSEDADGYTFVTHALHKSNFAFIARLNELLSEYDLSEKDFNIIKKCHDILLTTLAKYKK